MADISIKAEQPELRYPLGNDWHPDAGTMHAVADGVFWLNMPLPAPLKRINLWLIQEKHGWTLIDTGMFSAQAQSIWSTIERKWLQQLPLQRIIVTHMHPDHIGMAGWLCQRYQCPLLMSRGEYLMCRYLQHNSYLGGNDEELTFYRATGMTAPQLRHYRQQVKTFNQITSPLPNTYQRLHDGQHLLLGGHAWQVILGTGHSPEHACLYCQELKLLISGDQVLPTISSNLGVFPLEPDANPVEGWLESCQKLQRTVSDKTLTLPAHGEPFYGLHIRLDQLRMAALEPHPDLLKFLQKPRKVLDCCHKIYQRKLSGTTAILAISETLAHLNYLRGQNLIERHRDTPSGEDYYQVRHN